MAPPRKHETDVILDATRALVLADGPRAASVAAIATASGAPAGTLYHRFGNRDGILVGDLAAGAGAVPGPRDGRHRGTPRWSTAVAMARGRRRLRRASYPRTPGCC